MPWRSDACVNFFPTNFHFLFDDGSDDPVTEIAEFMFEFFQEAIHVIKKLIKAHHCHRYFEFSGLPGSPFLARNNSRVERVLVLVLGLS